MRPNKKPDKKRDSLARQKSHKSEEDLKGEVRKLKSVIRNLQKRLRYYEKIDHLLDDAMDIVREEEAQNFSPIEEDADKCPDCGKGELALLDLGKYVYTTCSLCSYRVKVDG